MPIVLDVRSPPLVQIAYIGDYADDELTAYLASLQQVFSSAGRKVVLFDLLRATVATASQRKRQAEFIGANDGLLRRDFLAAALVLDSALLRGAVTAVFWMRPLPMPTEIVPTLAAGLHYLAPYAAECARVAGSARPSSARPSSR